jgi:hypothetical protein
MQHFSDLRDEYIARVVSDKTFGEVGGLWGTVSEKVSVAHQHGATSLSMIDIQPEGNELWQKFHERMADLGIANVREISGDICEINNQDVVDPFDVVHCSGVLYHHPNPFVMLAALRRITRQYLVLTSAVTQTVIENECGRYEIPPSGVLLVPALNDDERAIIKIYWESQGARGLGLTEKCAYDMADTAPWWWLPTPTALTAMCQAAGFHLRDAGPTWNGNAHTLLLSV